MSGMNNDEIASMFRTAELKRREDRNRRLAVELRNANAAMSEELTAFDQRIHDTSITKIVNQTREKVEEEFNQRERERIAAEASLGYWRRLWRALLNK